MDYYAFMQTTVIAFGGMIALLCLIMGLERTVRIIMANYLIASIILGMGNLLELVSNQLLVGPAERWVDGLQQRCGELLIAGRPTILLTIYILLLLFISTKAHIGIGEVKSEPIRIVLLLIFVPCAVISIMFNIALSIYGNQLINLDELALLAKDFATSEMVYNAIMLTPLWIILPGLITIAVAAFILRSKDDLIRKDTNPANEEEPEEFVLQKVS